jgi:hypothetical protein
MGFPLPWHCMTQPEPRKNQRPNRPRIDISKIGQPTNFQHTGHIGTTEIGGPATMSTAKTQMQSKGGGASEPSSPMAVGSPLSSPAPVSGPASNALSIEEAQKLFGAKKAAAAAAAAAAQQQS